jgi:hypothetical protein
MVRYRTSENTLLRGESVRELVGKCIKCEKDLFCLDGFFNGIILENKAILCFECSEEEKNNNSTP